MEAAIIYYARRDVQVPVPLLSVAHHLQQAYGQSHGQ